MGKIILHNIVKKFADLTVIPSLDLEIKEGEFVVFVGPSGCGNG